MRVADFFVAEGHEIRQRENIRHGTQRLVSAIRFHHPERFVPAPARPAKIVPQLAVPKPIAEPPEQEPIVFRPVQRKGSEILHFVSKAMEVRVDEILGVSRELRNVYCRALIATTLRARGWSYPEIGHLLKRDHSSILNLCRKIDIYTRYSEDCRDVYAALSEYRSGK